MFGELKISFVVIADNQNKLNKNLKRRIWHHHNLVNKFLKEGTCLMGRRTFELTNWKGPKSWVITRDQKFKKSGVGTLHNLEDIRLFSDDEKVYVIGGKSLYVQLEEFVDEIHLYVFNNKDGDENWIDINMKEWKPKDYFNNTVWSYARLEKIKK